MKRKSKRQYDEVSYWESFSDILVGLLLCVLLVAVLLILYLIRIPDNEYIDEHYGITYTKYDDPQEGFGNQWDNDADGWNHEYEEYNNGGNGGYGGYGGGGDGDDDGEYENPGEYDDPDPGAGEGLGLDKAAIYVQVVDGETERTIKQKGMEYELYSAADTLQTLSVYYPQKIDYTRYETTADGVFYLPEKIALGSYYLHDLTVVKGYDTADKTAFTVDESRDWADPFVVTVMLYPSRGNVRIQLKDQDTGKGIGGAAFNIIASSNIVTQDGTTRYTAGQIVDTVVLDDSGYGESIPLYLGEYHLVQTQIPEYYAAIGTTPAVRVQRSSSGVKAGTTEVSEQKTAVNVTLADELYPGKGLAGAQFTLTTSDGTVNRRLTTDENGRIRLTDLRASTTYTLRQVTAPDSYERDAEDHAIVVDSQGYIDGAAVADITLTNAIVRVSIGVRGMLFRSLVSDQNLALYTPDGTIVKVWNSSALEQLLEGLTPGEYRLVLNGRSNEAQTLIVENTAAMQSFYFTVWTTADLGALVIALLVVTALLAATVILIRRKQSGNPDREGE